MASISRGGRRVRSSAVRSSRRVVSRRMRSRLHRGESLQGYSSGSQYRSGKIGESESWSPDDEE